MNVYIHIPFCAQNCSYCTFKKVLSIDQNIHQSYFGALKKEFETSSQLRKGDKIKTLYFGGGTPSLISAEILTDFFVFLKQNYTFFPDVEITLECHPASVTEEKLKAWEACGINRISLGVQTFQTKFDAFLERNLSHTKQALELFSQHPFRLSGDFIFGFPKQTEADLLADIQAIKSFPFEHISFYALDYKVGSKIEQKEDQRLEFETLCHFYGIITQELTEQGFEQYEIYNFSKNKRYSQHNLNFWRGEDYIGFGLSAVSGIGKTVIENTCNLKAYLQGDCIESQYDLNEDEQLEVFMKRRLRLISGLSLEELKRSFSHSYKQILENAKTISSWIHLSPGHVALTEEGRMNFAETVEILLE